MSRDGKGSGPHLYARDSITRLTWIRVSALIPAAFAAVFFHQISGLQVILTALISAALGEVAGSRVFGGKASLFDGQAIFTGLLLAMFLPSTLSLWMVFLAGFCAVFLGRQFWGGTGQAIFHPALLGHVLLQASFPVSMSVLTLPFDGGEGISPLVLIRQGFFRELPSLVDLLRGYYAGGLGETCALLLFASGLLLLWQKIFHWEIPFLFLGSLFLASAFSGVPPLAATLSGSGLLCAFFVVTDFETTPHTRKGMRFFAVGCGVLTVCLRRFSVYPDGTAFAILIMNTLTPWIDRGLRAWEIRSKIGPHGERR